MLQLHFSTPKGRRAAPLAREAGEGERQGAPPCAPTPLSHPVGEGLGVRAKKPPIPAVRNLHQLTESCPNPPSNRPAYAHSRYRIPKKVGKHFLRCRRHLANLLQSSPIPVFPLCKSVRSTSKYHSCC